MATTAAKKTDPKPDADAPQEDPPTYEQLYEELVARIKTDFAATGLKGAEAKLWWIQCHVENVAKTGQAPKFKFYQEHGILSLLRPYQEALAVLVLVDEEPGSFVADGNLVQATFVAQLVDLEQPFESPERRVTGRYVMQSTDNQGWAAAKLLTYGKKYSLQKFCGIPQDELLEAEVDAPKIERQATPPPAAAKVDVSALQRDVEAAAASDKAFVQKFNAHCIANYGVQRIAQLTSEDAVAELRAWVAENSAKKA